jgi:hypothetical protein
VCSLVLSLCAGDHIRTLSFLVFLTSCLKDAAKFREASSEFFDLYLYDCDRSAICR